MLFTVFAAFAQSAIVAEENIEEKEQVEQELFSPENIQKVSKTFGHMVYRSIDQSFVKFDTADVIQGFQDAESGQEAPMAEPEYKQMVSRMQTYLLKERADNNLKTAQGFLEENGKRDAVITLEEGFLQYEVLQDGDDQADVVAEGALTKVYYVGKYANGTVFSEIDRESQEPIEVDIKETIPGFQKGMNGMRVGEKRRIFIHPDFGYGSEGPLEPNSLLIFDIEVIAVNPKQVDEPLVEAGEEDISSRIIGEDIDEDIRRDDIDEPIEPEGLGEDIHRYGDQ